MQALQQSWKFISNTELMHPGTLERFAASRGVVTTANTSPTAPRIATHTIVDDASKCVVCFVTKQCCRAILDQKILQMTAEDAQTLKYSVCKDHSSEAGHVEFAMSIIDLYMKGLK